MSNIPRHLVMFASVVNLECDKRIINMVNSFCEAGTKVSVICPPQSVDNEEELAGLLHKSATVYRLPQYFPEQYDLGEYLGYSLSTLPQRLYSKLFSMGVYRQFDEPISKLPWGARQLLQAVADVWYKRVIKIRQDGLANHRYWNIYLAQQLPPAMFKKYKDVILLDCYDYFFFIQTLIINKSIEPVDAVFCNDLSTLPAGCLIKELLGMTLIFDSHEAGVYAIMNPRHKPIAEANERWMYDLCDRFITVSDSCADYFVRRCPSLKPIVIVNGYPFPWDRLKDAPTLKAQLSLPASAPLAVYVGELSPLSYMDRFIHAIPYCKTNLHLAILGHRGDIERLQQISKELDLLGKRVFFLGRVKFSDVAGIIYGADFGIIPNIQNNTNPPWSILSSKLFDYVQAELPFISDFGPQIQKILDQFNIGQTANFQQEPAAIAKVLDAFYKQVQAGDFSSQERRRAKHNLAWPGNVAELICLPPAVESSLPVAGKVPMSW